jgi:hypothetical protein
VKNVLTRDYIERWRDRVHRRRPEFSIASKRQAVKFVTDVGFCFAFKSEHSELPCLWHAAVGARNPVLPEHTHHDPYISFVWEMKEVLPAERKAYYGKLLKRRPTMVSLEFLPFFYVLSGRTGSRDEYVREFEKGRLSRLAKEIMDALHDDWPQSTKGLKLATGMSGKRDRAGFDKAMAELQEGMYVAKIREDHDPFSFVWAPLTRCFPKEIRKARRVSAEEAREVILEQYFGNQLVGTVLSIQRLFRWNRQDIFRSLGRLVQRGIISPGITVLHEPGRYYCLVNKRKQR